MSRLQKKCFIASTGLHLSLVLVLLVGPAFFTPSRKHDNVPVLTFLPMTSVNANVSSPGGPDAQRPPNPTPAPAQPPAAPATPSQPTERETAPTERHVVVPNLKPTVRNPNKVSANAPRANPSDSTSRQRIADQIGKAASGIRSGISSSVEVKVGSGPAGGGPSYASFEQTVLTYYDKAWVAPDGMDTSEAVVSVRVTVESDGRVSSARILQPSGDSRVDRSVREALDRVTYIPVPEGSDRRTVEFDFKSRAKQSI